MEPTPTTMTSCAMPQPSGGFAKKRARRPPWPPRCFASSGWVILTEAERTAPISRLNKLPLGRHAVKTTIALLRRLETVRLPVLHRVKPLLLRLILFVLLLATVLILRLVPVELAKILLVVLLVYSRSFETVEGFKIFVKRLAAGLGPFRPAATSRLLRSVTCLYFSCPLLVRFQ